MSFRQTEDAAAGMRSIVEGLFHAQRNGRMQHRAFEERLGSMEPYKWRERCAPRGPMAAADRHGVRRQLLGTCAVQPLQKSGRDGWMEGITEWEKGWTATCPSRYQKACFVVALGTWRPSSRGRW